MLSTESLMSSPGIVLAPSMFLCGFAGVETAVSKIGPLFVLCPALLMKQGSRPSLYSCLSGTLTASFSAHKKKQ